MTIQFGGVGNLEDRFSDDAAQIISACELFVVVVLNFTGCRQLLLRSGFV